MAVSPFCKPLGIVAAVISLIQGLVWIILSIIAILISTKVWKPSFSKATYGNLLSSEIIALYLNEEYSIKLKADLTIGPSEFLIFSIAYLVLSVIWVVYALIVIWIIFKRKVSWIKKWYLTLGISMGIICFYDLVLGCFFAYDYDTIVGEVNKNSANAIHSMKVLACGIVMTLAVKGFSLWIVNLIFSVITIKLAIDMPSEVSKDDFEPVVDAFGTSAATIKNETFGIFHGLPRLPPIQSTNERLTNLNKVTYPAPGAPAEFVNGSYLYSLQPDESDFDTNSVDSFANPPLKSALRNRY